MSTALDIVAIIVFAYLIGAIPNALIVGRVFHRTDIRTKGSGNLGATNAWRVLGWKSGLAVFLLDGAKGALAVGIASLLHSGPVPDPLYDWYLLAAAFSAVFGHSYSPYVRFAGGKGVATAAGAILAMTPLAWVILLATFLIVTLTTRMVSLGSIVIALLYPVLMINLYVDRTPLISLSVLAAALIIWRHRFNIGRIMRGEESKISFGRHKSEENEGVGQ